MVSKLKYHLNQVRPLFQNKSLGVSVMTVTLCGLMSKVLGGGWVGGGGYVGGVSVNAQALRPGDPQLEELEEEAVVEVVFSNCSLTQAPWVMMDGPG